MPDFPNQFALDPLPAINSMGVFPESQFLALLGSRGWPVALKAFYIPFSIEKQVTAYQMSWINGNTVLGNFDTGIYDIYGTRLVNMGTTAATGAAGAIELYDIADTVLKPGYYFMAMASDSTSGTVQASNPTASGIAIHGVCEQTLGALPLPSTASLSRVTSNYFPSLSIHCRSVV